MSGLQRLAAALTVLAFPFSAWGHGLGLRSKSASYCLPVTVRCVQVVPICPEFVPVCTIAPTSRARTGPTYAQPTAAPPSAAPATPAPPLANPPAPKNPLPPPSDRKPAVSESRSYYESYAGNPRNPSERTGNRCTAGFWNLTERDLTVKVDGTAHTVARGKNVQVNVGRQFVWLVDGRDPQSESIAAGECAVEIVIRR
jgi:hypothetical protein